MTEASLFRLVLSLVLVVLLLLALAWIARRSNWLRGAGQSGIRVLGMQSLGARGAVAIVAVQDTRLVLGVTAQQIRSEEHTSELQSLMRISYAAFCLKKKQT